jgi:hypothetical protein
VRKRNFKLDIYWRFSLVLLKQQGKQTEMGSHFSGFSFFLIKITKDSRHQYTYVMYSMREWAYFSMDTSTQISGFMDEAERR